MKNEYIILYPTCMAVKGAVRSVIYDLEKEEFHYVPNGMLEIIDLLKKEDYKQLLEKFLDEDRDVIQEYITFLLEKDLGFKTENPALYPDLNLHYDSSTKITNAVLDRNANSIYDLQNAIKQLDKLKCQDLQLRFYSIVDLRYVNEIMGLIHKTDLKSIEVFYHYNQETYSTLKRMINKWPKIKLLLVHSSPKTEVVFMNQNNFYTSNQGNLLCTEERILSEQNCGCISKSYFSINIESFAESQQHNSCLNKKISIDTEGNIKNCPTLKSNYGNFDSLELAEVIQNSMFLKYASITKDQIEVCRDCEHRYMCTDCRAFVSDDFAKPFKCNYNPYTACWEDKIRDFDDVQ